MRLFLPRLMLAASVLMVAACATRPPPGDQEAMEEFRQNNDPAEPTNRFFYKVNDGIDTYVSRPVAAASRSVVPGVVRRPIHNVLANLSSPIVFSNDVLQAKPRRAGDTMMRFLINSTAGVGGLFDVGGGPGDKAAANDVW